MDVCDRPGLRGGGDPSDRFGDKVNFKSPPESFPGKFPPAWGLFLVSGGESMLTRRVPRRAVVAAASGTETSIGGDVVLCEAPGEVGDTAGRSTGTDCDEPDLIGDVGREEGPEPAAEVPPVPARAGCAMRGAPEATEADEEGYDVLGCRSGAPLA
jgi:hypothetical protein